MRLGIFGGSFDPVHYGHLLLAESCLEQCQLDRLWFVPAAIPPHKQDRQLAPPSARVEMLKLALGGHSQIEVSETELKRGGVSYTVETLTEIQADHPDSQLFFLMGTDNLQYLPSWKQPEQLCSLASPIVVSRVGSGEPDFEQLTSVVSNERLAEIRQYQVIMPLIDLSSSEIRNRVAQGKSIRYHTPRAVEQYIKNQELYR